MRRKWNNFLKKWRTFKKRFAPVYNVDVTMYHFVPGMPVKAQRTRHSFQKGALDEAQSFVDRANPIFMGHEYLLAGKSQNEAMTPNFRIL